MNHGGYDYDVCLSFASEQRDYVEGVARGLTSCGVRVFYDDYEVGTLWGKDLYQHLDEVYRRRAGYCVMFVSVDYARKLWTNHERQSAQARAFTENREYVLPARFDDTALPGLRPTVGYLDLRLVSQEELVRRIVEKVRPDAGAGIGPDRPSSPPGPGRPPPAQPVHPLWSPAARPARTALRRRAYRMPILIGGLSLLVVIAVVSAVVFVTWSSLGKAFPTASVTASRPGPIGTTAPVTTNAAAGGPTPTVRDAHGPPPWMISGGVSYTYEIEAVTRGRVAGFGSTSPKDSLRIKGHVTRTGSDGMPTSMHYEVRDQDGNKLADTSTAPHPPSAPDSDFSAWEEAPTLGQRLPIVMVLYDTSPRAVSVSVTISDVFHDNEDLILRNIPVSG